LRHHHHHFPLSPINTSSTRTTLPLAATATACQCPPCATPARAPPQSPSAPAGAAQSHMCNTCHFISNPTTSSLSTSLTLRPHRRSRAPSYLGDDAPIMSAGNRGGDSSFDENASPEPLALAHSGSAPSVFGSDTLVLPNCGRCEGGCSVMCDA
jgi:hypothetical protein